MANDEMFVLEGETNKALSLMNKTFYSNKEIFLLELISNASDALDRIQFERIRDKNIVDDELIIRLVPHKGNKTFSIIDTGIGMTKTDLAYNLGVGFYYAYFIADKIMVTTKHNDHDEYIWESQKDASFMVTKDINAKQSSRGTNINLFLKDNQLEYLEENTIMNLVIKNCQHISHPIYLWTENTKDHWLLINIWSHNKERDDKFVAQYRYR
ncbi:heat shock protein 90-1-like [Phaseolus vulgaris]|uniref:heat shock protein 90-1-like n=1 Tax=Phaseolus vulgaris TaxID=3885 RepID=UPI0035CB34FD